jgi:hypothetical protein
MKTVLLDGNIYNKLEKDGSTRTRIRKLIEKTFVCVIATPKVKDELDDSPFGGIPSWFPVELQNEAVIVLGHARFGRARFGKGKVFEQHRGKSKKVSDAIIADSADALADILVSDDKRCRNQLTRISKTCMGMTYKEFSAWLKHL